MTTERRIRGYIEEYLLEEPFTGADPIAEEALDSVAIEELIDFLEAEYSVEFTDQELARESFGSARAVAALIETKRRLAGERQLPLAVSTIPEALVAATLRGQGTLVFHLEGGPVRLGGEELAERAEAAARWLAARGIGHGDRVGVMGPNRPQWAVCAYATWMAGAALVPLQFPLRMRDPAALAESTGSLVRAAGCKLVLADPALASRLPPDRVTSWEEPSRGARAELTPPGPDDPAVLQFTSGSTVAPKGAVITHAAMLAQVDATAGTFRPDPADEIVHGWAPFFHDLGLSLFLVTVPVVGATCHVLPTERFARDPAEWLRLVPTVEASMTTGRSQGGRRRFAPPRAARMRWTCARWRSPGSRRKGSIPPSLTSEVVVVPRDTIQKTTSGKLPRGAMRAAYERGAVPLST